MIYAKIYERQHNQLRFNQQRHSIHSLDGSMARGGEPKRLYESLIIAELTKTTKIVIGSSA